MGILLAVWNGRLRGFAGNKYCLGEKFMIQEIWYKHKWKIVIWLITIIEIGMISVLSYNYNGAWTDSDFASDLVLAEKLNEEHTLLSQNFYYSTELRVLHTQLIQAPLFSIFNDWALIRAISIFILLLIVALSYAFFAKNVMGEKGLTVMPFLVWPFSQSYFNFVIFGSCYVPCLAISFVGLGLYYKLSCCEKNRKFYILTGIYVLLGFVAGLGGFRQLLELYIPLFLAVIYLEFSEHLLTRKIVNRNTILATLGMVSALFGLVMNNGLHKVYKFYDMSEMMTTPVSAGRIFEILNGILCQFGYSVGNQLFSLTGILSMGTVLTIIIVVYLIYVVLKSERREEKVYGYYILFVMLLHLVAFLLTDMRYADRYWLPLIVMTFPLIGFGLSVNRSAKYKFTKVGTYVAAICIFVNGINVLKMQTDMPESAMRNEVADFLVDNGYSYGYAEYWSANLFTELTDGAVRICSIVDWNTLGVNYWLMREEDIGRVCEDKVFILDDKMDEFDLSRCKYIDSSFVVFENDRYVVYSYKNTQDLMQYLN